MYGRISGFSDEIDSNTDIQFSVLNKLGIRFYEPRRINAKNISELTESEAEQLKSKMDKCGIKASSIGSPIGKIKLSDDFDMHFELFKNVVKTAKILGTNYIRVFSFYHSENIWTQAERTEVLQKLRKMIEYAQKENVTLLHENEKDIYGDTAERCRDLFDELACDNFKAVFDPANFVQCGQDTIKAYEKLKPYIAYMHIKDAKAGSGAVVPSGFGDGNIEYILKDLFESGYKGFLSLEPHLGSFEGLSELETTTLMNDLPKGGEGTFTLALDALKKIIGRTDINE